MFELTVLGLNVVLPSLVTLLGAALALRLPLKSDESSQTTGARQFARSLLVCTAAALAIWSALALRTEWAVWHSSSWMRIPLGVSLVALSAAVTAGLQNAWWTWCVRALAAWVAAWIIFPTGEAWEFLRASQYLWLTGICLSVLVGWLLIEHRTPRGAAILGLSWILVLIAAAYLTGQSFLKVTEPLMAVASVLGVLSLISLRTGADGLLAPAAGPCLFAASAIVASAQFNSFLGLPDALSWLAMFSPSLAAMLTHWSGKRAATRRELIRATCISLVVCGVLAAAIIGWTHQALPVAAEDDEW